MQLDFGSQTTGGGSTAATIKPQIYAKQTAAAQGQFQPQTHVKKPREERTGPSDHGHRRRVSSLLRAWHGAAATGPARGSGRGQIFSCLFPSSPRRPRATTSGPHPALRCRPRAGSARGSLLASRARRSSVSPRTAGERPAPGRSHCDAGPARGALTVLWRGAMWRPAYLGF
jgi:hypothetical protein